MKYTAKTFTLPASGKREDPCTHGWLDPRGRCVLCGEAPQTTHPEWNATDPTLPLPSIAELKRRIVDAAHVSPVLTAISCKFTRRP